MSSESSLSARLSKKTSIFGLRLYVVIGICVAFFTVLILCILFVWTISRRKFKTVDKSPLASISRVPKDVKIVRVGTQRNIDHPDYFSSRDEISDKFPGRSDMSRSSDPDSSSQCNSVYHHNKTSSLQSGDDGSSGNYWEQSSLHHRRLVSGPPAFGQLDISRLRWGHWFTLRDLDLATNYFSAENVLGEGGYGVVYWGKLINGTEIAVKKILNNLGQAEKEFRIEVETIGHVRHKNLVSLLGYCIEGTQRMLVYEYVDNGNLEQWLHGAMRHQGTLTWEARMKILLDTAKALAYLHEAIEPKVVHRDIKSSNILIDKNFNAKVSDFGLAKLLGSDQSHLSTRVMGTVGYVAPEYANSGLLNEKNDIYSFGVLLLEAVTGRHPVDYECPADEVNLVEWVKIMIGAKRTEDVADPILEVKPTSYALKRVLLAALRCINHDAEERPKMSQVVQILEAHEFPFYKDRRNKRRDTASMDIEDIS